MIVMLNLLKLEFLGNKEVLAEKVFKEILIKLIRIRARRNLPLKKMPTPMKITVKTRG
jgi:hypothetical protein